MGHINIIIIVVPLPWGLASSASTSEPIILFDNKRWVIEPKPSFHFNSWRHFAFAQFRQHGPRRLSHLLMNDQWVRCREHRHLYLLHRNTHILWLGDRGLRPRIRIQRTVRNRGQMLLGLKVHQRILVGLDLLIWGHRFLNYGIRREYQLLLEKSVLPGLAILANNFVLMIVILYGWLLFFTMRFHF